jgi:hypothetical protein
MKGRGNDVGPTCQRQPNCGAFSISIYFFITWLRLHLQPSTLVASFNFNPRRQLHPSSTSILLANFIPRRRQLQPSRLLISEPLVVLFAPLLLDDAHGVLDAAAASR